MTEHAHVGSSDAIDEFRAAVLTFQDEVQSAIDSIEMKAGQTLRFLDEDAPIYWATQTRVGYDDVNATRIALAVCRNKTIGGRRSSCIEEKKAYAKAQDRLELCRRKQSLAKKTAIDAHDAADEFRARMAELHRIVESEIPKLMALLQRTSVSLEAYTAARPSRQPLTGRHNPFVNEDTSDDSEPNDEASEETSSQNKNENEEVE